MALNHPESVQKITLMIVGAQKAGTTSMKNYLGQHPSLETHPHKEFAFFFDPEQYENEYEVAQKKYFSNKLTAVQLIAKNAGLYVKETGIARLKAHNPDCKLILILRNPVERTYSSFLMEKNYGMIDTPFESIKSVIEKQDRTDWRFEFLIGMGIYFKHLEMIYNYFPLEQVKIIRYEDFEEHADKICKDIFKWIGVDETFSPDVTKRFNETTVTRSSSYAKFIVRMLKNHNPVKKAVRKILPGKMDYRVGELLRSINKRNRTYDSLSIEMNNLLVDFFTPYNNELSKLTGMDFSDWNEKK